MKILVTGGSGFVGSRLIENLNSLRAGHEIINLDIADPKSADGSKFVKCDITDYNSLMGLADTMKGVDVVYHLAALSREADSMKMPVEYHKTNVTGTFNVLDFARMVGAKRFVMASTYLVYGDPLYTPLDERHPTNPKTVYAATKLCDEVMCKSFQEIYGMEAVIFRKSVIYGENDPHRRIVTLFVERAKQGKDLTVFGDKTLDFVYVGDVVSAYTLALQSREKGTFNICSGKSTSLLELANIVKDTINPEVRVVEEGMRVGEVASFTSDISMAKSLLGFNPKQDLKKFVESCAK